MFVPWKPKDKMHVLMVAPVLDHGGAGGAGDNRASLHYPRVFYDATYDDSNMPKGQVWRVVPLEGTVLDLSAFKGVADTAKNPEIPEIKDMKNLVDVSPYMSNALGDVEQVPPPENMGSRLTLPRGKADTSTYVSNPWRLEGPPGHSDNAIGDAAWAVVWTVQGISESEMKWELNRLYQPENLKIEPLPPLHPDQNGKIKLLVSNVVRKESFHELGAYPRPVQDTPMPHFEAFRDVCKGRPSWPKLVYKANQPPPPPRGTPYTCVPSGGH
jgi:hypothetical protein